MSQILTFNNEGKSSHSLLEAISKAVVSTLKSQNGKPASINIIVEGYEFDGEEYVAKVRVMIMPHDLELDNKYHENDGERHDHQQEAEGVAIGFTAAAYDIGLFDSVHDDVLQRIQANIAEKIIIEGKIILIASEEVHDLLRHEVKELRLAKENNLDLPSLDIDGSRYGGNDEAA